MLADPAVEVVHLTTPEPPALRAGQARRSRPASTSSARSRWRWTRPRRPSSSGWPSESGLVHAVNFNIRFYPQVPAGARGASQAGEIGDVRLISGGYLQDWLLRDTDWNWRLDPAAGGGLRAVGDIGSHWLDLVQFVTGRRVEAVMADLTTFIPVRKQPTGPVETFSGAACRRDGRHADGDRGLRRHPAPAQRRRARGGDGLAGLAPAARTGCTGRSTAPPTRWPGTPRIPRSCGSATVTGRTS